MEKGQLILKLILKKDKDIEQNDLFGYGLNDLDTTPRPTQDTPMWKLYTDHSPFQWHSI
jgi:hypothetical protein